MTSRKAWMVLAVLLVGACTTKFKEPADSNAEGDVLPDGVDGDAEGVEAADDGPGDSDAEDPVPDVSCTTDEECILSIGDGYICCDTRCVDGAHDPAHCGRCDIVCGEDRACCGGYCIDLMVNLANCGGCGNACDPNNLCCAGSCSNSEIDPEHCGECDNRCDFGIACQEAMCTTCGPDTIRWTPDEHCYIEGGLGRFSHYSVLAPVFDGRIGSVPGPGSPLYNPPIFGVLTVDNVPIAESTAIREYFVEVRRWGPDGSIDDEFVREYAGDSTGILAFDAVHLPRPGMPGRFLVMLGGLVTGATADNLFIDTLDLSPGPLYTEPFVHDAGTGGVATPAVYWQLPVPYEAVLSLAGISGGAVMGVGSSADRINIPAAAIKRAPPATDAMLDWPGRTEQYAYASHVAVGQLDDEERIFILVTDDRNDSANPGGEEYDVRLYCFKSAGIDLEGPSPAMVEACWPSMPYVQVADETDLDEVGLALATGPAGFAYVVYGEGDRVCKIVGIDSMGAVSATVELPVDSVRGKGVSALLVDAERRFIYVVGYHFGIATPPNHEKTPAIWKLSDGLGIIGAFGINGRRDYGEGFFSDAILLCDGSILAKIYHDPWSSNIDDHSDDRVCLVRYDGVNGDPL